MTTDYLLHKEVDGVLSLLTEGNRLACAVALQTGLRIGDVLSLRREQIAPRMWVTESKTGKRRQVGMPTELANEVLRYSESVSRSSPWAFPGRKPTEHRTRQAVWKDVKRAASSMRLRTNAGPHSFRKIYAVRLLQEYGDIERVRRALKHDRQTTTMIYAMADLRLKSRKTRRAATMRRP